MRKLRGFALFLFAVLAATVHAQWAQLTNNAIVGPTTIRASTMFLMTDGTVLCQDSNATNWFKLTPDAFGNYQNGTWSQVASMHTPRLYYSSSILADGRLFIAGGEYTGGNTATQDGTYEIYNPLTDSWTNAVTVPGMNNRIGDGPCTVLEDGRFLIGQSGGGGLTVIFDPATDTFSAAISMLKPGSEESWCLMPDGTVIAPQCRDAPGAEKYLPDLNTWVTAGTVNPNVVELASNEIGSMFLLPDEWAFVLGANGNTSFYTAPGNPHDPGSWSPGPTMPLDGSNMQLGCKDTPGVLLPNGDVIFVVGPVDGISGNYLTPTSFLLWSAASNTFSVVSDPAAPFDNTKAPYTSRMLLLPTGQVLYAQEQGNGAAYIYTPGGSPSDSWRPIIDNAPAKVIPGGDYLIEGRQFNGISQCAGYGDDAFAPTNYPLVRITNNGTGHVFFCRTHDHSHMGVAMGSTANSTHFKVPGGIEGGASTMVVIANGIASSARAITIETENPITHAQLSGTLGNNQWYVSNVSITLTTEDAQNDVTATHYKLDGGSTQDYSGPIVVSADGLHSLEFWSEDAGSHVESPHNFVDFKIDQTDPIVTYNPQSPPQNGFGWNNSTVTISFTTSDATSGVASADHSSPLTFSSEGAGQTQTVTVTDNAGNSAGYVSATVNIDLTMPTTTAAYSGTSGCNGWFQGPVTVTLTASDNLSGVQVTRYILDGGAHVYGGNFVISGDGIHSLEFWSVDKADNEEAHHTATIKIDSTPPVVTGTPDKTILWAPNHKMVPVTVTGSMTDATSGIDPATAKYQVVDEYGLVQPSGSITVGAGGAYTFTVMLEVSRLGTDMDGRTYTIKVSVKDMACNQTTINIVVKVPHDQGWDGLLAQNDLAYAAYLLG